MVGPNTSSSAHDPKTEPDTTTSTNGTSAAKKPMFRKKMSASAAKKAKARTMAARQRRQQQQKGTGANTSSSGDTSADRSVDTNMRANMSGSGEAAIADAPAVKADPESTTTSLDDGLATTKREDRSSSNIQQDRQEESDEKEDDIEKEEGDDGGGSTTLSKIQQLQKRRKLLSSLSGRGVGLSTDGAAAGTGMAALGGAVGAARRKRLNQGAANGGGKGRGGVKGGSKKAAKKGEDSDDQDRRDSDEEDQGASDLRQRLEGTFGAAVGPSDGINDMDDIGGNGGGGVLGRRHREAMERYVRERMGGEGGGSANNNRKRDGTKREKGASGGRGTTEDEMDEDALYRQIAREVGVGVGGGPEEEAASELINSAEGSAEGGGGGAAKATNANAKEDDVGAGGTMLHGTGIAEVALPVEERIRTVRETELASSAAARGGAGVGGVGGGTWRGGSASRQAPSMNNDPSMTMLPTSFGKRKHDAIDRSGAALTSTIAAPSSSTSQPTRFNASGRPIVASSAGTAVLPSDVSSLGQSYSHNFKLHTHQWVTDRKTERERELDEVRKAQDVQEGTGENRARVGFERARRVAKGEEEAQTGASGISGAAARAARAAGTGGAGGAAGQDRSARGSTTGMGGQQSADYNRNRSNDDRVWRSFVSKARNRR